MPGWIAPDDINTIVQDLQSRVRRLETYNAAPLYASSVLLTDVASAALTGGSFGYQTAWTVAYSQSFTLAAQQTVLCVYQQAYYGSGGTANYVLVAQNVDTNSTYAGGVHYNTNGAGISNSTLLLRMASLPAGNHTWYGIYNMVGGATTSYNTLHPQIDIYVIGA